MQANSEQAASFMKLLANASRLLVLCALVDREHTAGELEALTGLSQSAVSQHLARLRGAGLVDTRREAQCIYYSLADARAQAMLETLYTQFCPEKLGGAVRRGYPTER